jgi:D-arginine dehydrogenase
MTTTADVIIIGGGIAGMSLAARLAADRQVVLLEAEDQFAYHSTGRSAAMFIVNYGPPVIRQLNRLSEDFFRNHKGFSDTPLLSPRGQMTIDFGDDSEDFETYITGSHGLEILNAKEATSLVPILNEDQVQRAAYESNASEVDVHQLFTCFQRRAKASGAQLHKNRQVQAITTLSNGAWQVKAKDEVYEAPIMVNAAGAWADQIAIMAGVAPCQITPKRRSAVMIPGPHGSEAWPMFVPAAENWYAKPDAGRLMISPADQDPVEAHDAYPDDMVLAEGIDRFSQKTTLEVTRIERSWAGLRSFAPDHDPVVGFDPDHHRFFWLAGQGGYGIQTSPALSRFAANLILEQAEDQRLQLSLSPSRFPARGKSCA